MAEFSGVIDKSRLPRVKEVCRDFAVLEDHCLAHSLQEQEIESHLASNVHKSRLVQKDLQVAKRLQEEEDLRAKAQKDRRHKDIERSDNEMAQEIQEQLVRQAEQQRKQEEKDEAMARKMQEREMKEEKKRQKQQEANFEEEYYEEKGAPPAGRMVRGGEYGLREASQGLARMDLREQELRDMEVARRMQEEELKANQLDVQAAQAAQVAQDEEIARLWMEEEKRMYKKSRDKEKLPMEKRRPEGDWKPAPEEMMQPRSRDEYEYQRARNNKPARPPTRQPIYENISYAHQESPYPPHPASRPDSAYKGAYYRQ
ncbi:coiled-coil domain-containing protein 50-like isoform X2 [Denticeps clupeoides]|uniref:Coiled-coil domain-containing protein n=1 Tax=Denticeps clupeoides TaxID=299321 RepID=A0AAY4EAC6_9TELE|nr:coiled-coil domain-containing protein 50-like isoform X2 [Denticeps clupeoides]